MTSATPRSPRILQLNTVDMVGGAAKIAWMLHQAYQQRGYDAWLAVGQKQSTDATVLRIPNAAFQAWWLKLGQRISATTFPLPSRVRQMGAHLAKIHRRLAKKSGHENFYFPGSRRVLDLPPQQPEIVHAHNLHGLYFDLRVLPRLSSQVPLLLTLHDAWMLSGYCAHSFECERWQTGCGQCPYIDRFPVQRDATAANWRRKQRIYAQSRVYVATPSKWLMQKVQQSILAPAIIEGRVIPNGMDLTHFCPGDRQSARAELGIPDGTVVVLATAAKIVQNLWKDYATMRAAIAVLGRKMETQPICFLVLGSDQPAEHDGRTTITYIPYQPETAVMRYYQAADVYIHAAHADTFPNTVIEALACGTPVVATAIGGIPEQIDDGETGFLDPAEELQRRMASAMFRLLENPDLHAQMSQNASTIARQRFDVTRMVDEYLCWYQEILASR